MKKHFFSKIKGVKFNQNNIKEKLKEGDELKFVIESDNKWDENAIAVYHNEDKIGYISKKFNKKLKYRLEQGKKYRVVVANLYKVPNTTIIGCNIRVQDL